MNLSKIMLILQQNSDIGMVISVLIVVGLYLFISTRILIKSRGYGEDVTISCYIPVINIFKYWGIKAKRRRIIKKQKKALLVEKKNQEKAEMEAIKAIENADMDDEIDIF